MNIKQKCIEAMNDEFHRSYDTEKVLDAVLAVLADPENWTPEMAIASFDGTAEWVNSDYERGKFAAVINHVREQKE